LRTVGEFGAVSESGKYLSLTQNPVHLGTAGGANALGHAATVLFNNFSGEVALFTALHAVSVSGVTFLSHRVLQCNGAS